MVHCQILSVQCQTKELGGFRSCFKYFAPSNLVSYLQGDVVLCSHIYLLDWGDKGAQVDLVVPGGIVGSYFCIRFHAEVASLFRPVVMFGFSSECCSHHYLWSLLSIGLASPPGQKERKCGSAHIISQRIKVDLADSI